MNLIRLEAKLSTKNSNTKNICKICAAPQNFIKKVMMEGGGSSSLASLQDLCLKIKYKLKDPTEVIPCVKRRLHVNRI